MIQTVLAILENSIVQRLGYIVAIVVIGHLALILLKRIVNFLLGREAIEKHPKIRSIMSLLNSVAVFALYFSMVGYCLNEFNISLTAYFASATVIGLAVGFGSQGVVQDVVTGLTVVFSDLIDVDDTVEMSGQVGIVRSIGIRFIVLENPLGARVFIPNRTIANVINYRKGYVRCFVDVRLAEEEAISQNMERLLTEMMNDFAEQYPNILLAPPSVEGRRKTQSGKSYFRIKFRIWPGRGGPLETLFKQELVKSMQTVHPGFTDWMVSVLYETEKRK